MVILKIDNTTYKVIEEWSELTVKKARHLFELSSSAPEALLYIYKEQAKGDNADKDQIALRLKELDSKQDELDIFFKKVLLMLSDVPKKVIKKTAIADVRVAYYEFLMKFVFGPIIGIDCDHSSG